MLGYNRMTGYNIARYNAEGTELAATDSITVTGSTVVKSFLRTLADLFITSDTTTKQQNKSVNDNIKLDVWLRHKRDDSNLWGD